MISMTLSNLRNKTDFFDIDDIATIVDGRKKEAIGYFVPKIFKKDFEKFMAEMEKKRKREVLERVLKASRKDPVEDGAAGDGIA